MAERNAEKEARRIAEEEERLKAEALAREEAEFLKEYNYRKQHYGVRDDYRKIAVSEKNRREMIIESVN